MKKLLFLFVPIILLNFISCKKDSILPQDSFLELRGPSDPCYELAVTSCTVDPSISSWASLPNCTTIYFEPGDYSSLGDLPTISGRKYIGILKMWETNGCPDIDKATLSGVDFTTGGAYLKNFRFKENRSLSGDYIAITANIIGTCHFEDCIFSDIEKNLLEHGYYSNTNFNSIEVLF